MIFTTFVELSQTMTTPALNSFELSRVTKVSTLLSIAREVVFMEDETMYPNLIVGLMRYGTAFLHFSLNASTAFVLCSRYTVVHCLPLLSCISEEQVP